MERGQAGTIMSHFVLFVGLCFLLGGLAVASNPSLYSEDAGLMLASVAGCGWGHLLYVFGAVHGLFGWNVSGLCLFFVFSGRSFSETWGDSLLGCGIFSSFWRQLLEFTEFW